MAYLKLMMDEKEIAHLSEDGQSLCANEGVAPVSYTHLDVYKRQLLDDADIPTLQEYLGYCLIPSTKGQKMMLIVGKGGEGKSRIGLVLKRLMGDAASNGSVQKVENNRFARADLERRLLMIDDDMDMNALPKTNYIKTIVTAEAKPVSYTHLTIKIKIENPSVFHNTIIRNT